MRIAPALVAALALGMAACSTLELNTDYNPATDFSKYRTFRFGEGAKPRNPQAARSVRYAVSQALEGKGLKEVETGGDLLIYGHFVQDEKFQVETYGYYATGWYGYGWGGTVGTTTVRRIPVGTLVLDLVDASTKNLAWRGIVKDEISQDLYPEEREKKAIGIARDLFANYPPKPKK
jgi:hypothetical protein